MRFALWVIGILATAGTLRAQGFDNAPTPHVLRWSPSEVVLAGVFTTTMWIDAAQTRDARRSGYYERNPILGKYPSDVAINLYGLAASTVVLGTAAALPRPWRTVLLVGATALQTKVIVRSVRLGIPIQF